jgi:hypothetical protein
MLDMAGAATLVQAQVLRPEPSRNPGEIMAQSCELAALSQVRLPAFQVSSRAKISRSGKQIRYCMNCFSIFRVSFYCEECGWAPYSSNGKS